LGKSTPSPVFYPEENVWKGTHLFDKGLGNPPPSYSLLKKAKDVFGPPVHSLEWTRKKSDQLPLGA